MEATQTASHIKTEQGCKTWTIAKSSECFQSKPLKGLNIWTWTEEKHGLNPSWEDQKIIEPRSSPRCYCCNFSAFTLYSSRATSSVERLPSAKRPRCARCFYNHVWQLHPRRFRNRVKTPCFWSALSVPRSVGAVWLTVYLLNLSHSWRRLIWEQGILNRRPGLVH